MPGLERILNGVIRFRQTVRKDLVKQFERIRDNPHPTAVFFTCMDSRMLPARYRHAARKKRRSLVLHACPRVVHGQPTRLRPFFCAALHSLKSCHFRITSSQVGDMFVVRNSGNMIPHANNYGKILRRGDTTGKENREKENWKPRPFLPPETPRREDLVEKVIYCAKSPSGYEVSVTTEPAALELAVKRGKINHVIVCGHSDCKAINTLYNLHKCPKSFDPESPMDHWLRRHGFNSIRKLEKRLADKNAGPIEFVSDNPLFSFSAVIDPEDKLNVEDKLSQINTLQQLENVASHGFLKRKPFFLISEIGNYAPQIDFFYSKFKTYSKHIFSGIPRVSNCRSSCDVMLKQFPSKKLCIQWASSGEREMHMFSKPNKQFVLVDESNVEELIDECPIVVILNFKFFFLEKFNFSAQMASNLGRVARRFAAAQASALTKPKKFYKVIFQEIPKKIFFFNEIAFFFNIKKCHF
nr:hypothetical protein Y116A8C.28 - Caenorhabditis elegans [Caenorhabditis elegans]